MTLGAPLLATPFLASPLWAASSSRTYHEFARLRSLTEGWQWLLLVVVVVAVIAYVAYMYCRDSVELSTAMGVGLAFLRLMAFGGILFYFLDLQQRTQKQLIKESRVVVLVDTSQSMGFKDAEELATGGPSRIEQVVAEFEKGQLLEQLRSRHRVLIYKFDQNARPAEVASLPRLAGSSDKEAGETATATPQVEKLRGLAWSRGLAIVAAVLLGISVLAGLIHGLAQAGHSRAADATAWGLLISIVTLIAAVVVLAAATLRSPDAGWLAILGVANPDFAEQELVVETADSLPDVRWSEQLVPQGAKTRLGDAVRAVVNKERGGPIAGLVVVTDGRNNDGTEVDAAAALAREAGIPVFPIGMGSEQRPVNVRIVDVEAPERVYPGDDFTLSAYLQTFGLSGKSVTVELYSSAAGTADPKQRKLEEQKEVKLREEGEILPVEFQLTPEDKGRREYVVRVKAPREDRDPRDNERTTLVDVVDRKNRVLLISGGPSREYRFLSNMLYRDRDTHVEVWLQSGFPGMSQEAHEILYEFPADREKLFEFDCIVAFDPDWDELDDRDVELLEQFVSENAGGLVVTAGPVNTREWTRFRRGASRKIDTIKALYPVVFYSQGSAAFNLGDFGGDKAWPLAFTRDGQQAEFLWIEDDAARSEQTWSSFPGVYGYYAVKDPKPGATVFSRFSDPQKAIDGVAPIYLAGQFYGAGRVFFQASSEMWRLRAMDDSYFEAYYTKLIRWASQGRLLRDSARGLLLTDKERCQLGESVVVRAILKDAQHRPLTESQVIAAVQAPDGKRARLVLQRVQDASRDGTYSAQFTALQEGNYRTELLPPGAASDELLTRDIRVVATEQETARPERDDPLLRTLAEQTNGEYYVGLDAALNRDGAGRPLANVIQTRRQTTYLPGTPDRRFEEKLMTWLMVLISGVLCVEWLIRRLSKLA